MNLSVVIPTLNEAAFIRRTLCSVVAQPGVHEIIVVDGGSTDATTALAADYATTILRAPRGRASQMNAGAACASGALLLFLHADTLLPQHATRAIAASLQDPACGAGLFRLRFDVQAPLLDAYSACTRMPWTRLAFGDRGLFVRRTLFEHVGGFPDVPLLEDLEIVRRLQTCTRLAFRPEWVTTSARRFLQVGLVRQQLLNARIWTRYLLGEPPERLEALYAYAR